MRRIVCRATKEGGLPYAFGLHRVLLPAEPKTRNAAPHSRHAPRGRRRGPEGKRLGPAVRFDVDAGPISYQTRRRLFRLRKPMWRDFAQQLHSRKLSLRLQASSLLAIADDQVSVSGGILTWREGDSTTSPGSGAYRELSAHSIRPTAPPVDVSPDARGTITRWNGSATSAEGPKRPSP